MRVLVVEDEVSMANSLRAGLEAEGYVVEVAHDGEEGLWRASEFAFDAVVLDIMIPKLNGFIVARRLREAGRTVPILMLTAKSGEFDQTEALDTGADEDLDNLRVETIHVVPHVLQQIVHDAEASVIADLDRASHKTGWWHAVNRIETTRRPQHPLTTLPGPSRTRHPCGFRHPSGPDVARSIRYA